jgi:hypothetical protein
MTLFKYLIFIFLLLYVILGFTGCSNDDLDYTDNLDNGIWTIMVYMDADNNLEQDGLNDINEMESVNLEGYEINIIVLFDRCSGYSAEEGDWQGTRLYQVRHDQNENAIGSLRLSDPDYLNLTDTGDNEELDMGEPATVTGFVDYCKEKYPAEYYALVFWNHGGGWRSRSVAEESTKQNTEIDTPNRAVCWDVTNDSNCLYMSEVRAALEAITEHGIDLVGFDACLMGMAEVAYQLYGVADYMVASQASEPLSGWAYDKFLSDFLPFADSSPEVMGRFIVDTYIDYTYENNLTLSVVNIGNTGNLINRLNTLAGNMLSYDTNDIIVARRASHSVDDYIDLYDLADNMSHIPGAEQLLDEFNNTVIYHRQKDFPYSHGLSIYFPYLSTSDSEYSYYNSSVINFARDSLWDEFLADYYSTTDYFTIKTEENNGAGSEDTDPQMILYSSDGDYMSENDDYNYGIYFPKIHIPLVRGNTYYLHVFIEEPGFGGGPYTVSVCEYNDYIGSATGNPSQDAYEPNNDWDSATVLPFGELQDHWLTDNDNDWIKFTIP